MKVENLLLPLHDMPRQITSHASARLSAAAELGPPEDEERSCDAHSRSGLPPARPGGSPAGKRKAAEFIIKDGNAAIYRGKLPPIPESLKRDIVRRENGVVSYFVRNVGSTAREYMRDVIEFYAEKGFAPVIDTIQM